MRGTRWTAHEAQLCQRMVRKGMTYNEIAEALGRSKYGVRMYIDGKRKKSPDSWKEIEKRAPMQSKQPCWTCYYATGRSDDDGWVCPWASRLKPVDGWDAIKVRRVDNQTDTFGYIIKRCPKHKA